MGGQRKSHGGSLESGVIASEFLDTMLHLTGVTLRVGSFVIPIQKLSLM